MLRTRKVIVGNYYVDGTRKIARQVLGIADKIITFKTYHLDNGNSTGYPSICLKTDFIHWADHEATSREINILHNHEMEALLHAPQTADWENPKKPDH